VFSLFKAFHINDVLLRQLSAAVGAIIIISIAFEGDVASNVIGTAATTVAVAIKAIAAIDTIDIAKVITVIIEVTVVLSSAINAVMIAIMFSLKASAQLLSCLHCSLRMNRTAVSRSLRDSRHLTGTLDLNQNVLLQTNLLLPLPLLHHPFLKNEHPISDLVLLHPHRDRYLVLAIVFLLHHLFLEEI